MSKRLKQITTTTLVEDALRATDDFMSYAMLMRATNRAYNQVTAACFLLRKYRAADVVVNPDGTGWWFALPPESDTRTRHVEERTPETHPRRQRKSRRKPNE